MKIISDLWFIFRAKVLRQKRCIEKRVKEEESKAKTYKYETFEDFLRDAPKYQLETGIIAAAIRNLYRIAGARYQQFVFIDQTSPTDRTAWLRRIGNTIVHEKGTYALPWRSEKEILYFDITDMRPLIDLTQDIDWKNQDTAADVVTAITNAQSMAAMDGQKSRLSQYVFISMIMTGISIVLIIAILYQMDKAQKEQLAVLNQILENMVSGVAVVP